MLFGITGRPGLSEGHPRAPGDGPRQGPRRAGGRRRSLGLEPRTAPGADARQPRRSRRGGRGRLRKADVAVRVRGRRLHRPGHLRASPRGVGRRRAAAALPRDPAGAVRGSDPAHRRCGLRHERARRDREALRSRPRVRASPQRGAAARVPRGRDLPDRSLPRARSRSRTSRTSGSRTRSSSRSGTATTWTACRSRWPRSSACASAARSTTRWGRSATWCRTTSCRSWRWWRWSPRAGSTATCS